MSRVGPPGRPPPRIGSIWVIQGDPAVVAEIDMLVGTSESRYLIRVEPLEKDTPKTKGWYKDGDFWMKFRRNWTRYDMIRENEVLDGLDD